MKTKKWMLLMTAVGLMAVSSSCHDWGEMDPPAADDIFPTLENVAEFTFSDEELDPMVFKTGSYTGFDIPELYADAEKGQVLYLNNGYVTLNNPLNRVKCQNAVSMTWWMKQGTAVTADDELEAQADDAAAEEVVEPQDLTGALLGFTNDNETGRLFFTANGWLSYSGIDGEWSDNDPALYETGYIVPTQQWHYVALIVKNDGYALYVDGQLKVNKTVTNFDCSKLVQFMNNVSTLYIGKGSDTDTTPWMIDDLKLYRNQITDKEIARPKLGGGSGPGGPGGSESLEPVKPVYFNSFDGGANGATIFGGGEFKYVGGVWGSVFSNAMDGMRTNYLMLPEHVLSHSAETKALTIGVWVNRGNETVSGHYMWSPLFTAYGSQNTVDNSWPMLACQYRGVLQVNNNGWSDYTNEQNLAGVNALYHDATDWLADGNWHYYTATFTPTTAKVYFDGEVVNEWELDGVGNTAAGLFEHGDEYHCIGLGGNQAWNWGDPDPGFWFDDIAIYNVELSQAQIKNLMALKTDPTYCNTFSGGAGDATLMGGGSFIDNATNGFGKIFKNAVGGMRENFLKLPATAFDGISSTEEMTVMMWVNSTDAGDYYWNPLFTAFGSDAGGDGNPMMACQYRGVVSWNTEVPNNTGAEYCDYGADLSDTGEVILYHGDRDWLADKQWHLYTATFTPTRAIVYFDGEIANSWTLDGESRGQICNMKAVDLMKTICVCGNQAWGWGDPDPGFGIDDVILYKRVLSQDEIKQLMLLKLQ